VVVCRHGRSLECAASGEGDADSVSGVLAYGVEDKVEWISLRYVTPTDFGDLRMRRWE
jgi:hypothetical protein